MMSAWKLMVCCDLNRVLQIWILVETFSGSHPWREISMTEQENEPPKHMSGRRTKRFDFNQKYCVVKNIRVCNKLLAGRRMLFPPR
jgi:hypothetical protein